GLALPRKIGFDPRTQRFAGDTDIQYPDDRNSRPGDYAVPMSAGPIVRGIQGMLAHFAEEKNAIGATQRAHPETVEYRWVRKAPVAPCQEAREIGIEIAGAEALCGEYGIAPEQDAAVPNRLLALFA